jgi:hypothetical protein
LIEIIIKEIGHKRTDQRVKRLFYNMNSVLARAGGIFLQPERRVHRLVRCNALLTVARFQPILCLLK